MIVSSGATQSNHARMTAAAARAVGLDCVLVLSARQLDPPLQGNLLLDRLFGATIHFIQANPDPRFAVAADEVEKVNEVVADLTQRRPPALRDSHRRIESRRRARLRRRDARTDGATHDVIDSRRSTLLRERLARNSGRTRARRARVHADVSAPRHCGQRGEEEKQRRAARLATDAAALSACPFASTRQSSSRTSASSAKAMGFRAPNVSRPFDFSHAPKRFFSIHVTPGKAMAGLIHDVRSGAIVA